MSSTAVSIVPFSCPSDCACLVVLTLLLIRFITPHEMLHRHANRLNFASKLQPVLLRPQRTANRCLLPLFQAGCGAPLFNRARIGFASYLSVLVDPPRCVIGIISALQRSRRTTGSVQKCAVAITETFSPRRRDKECVP